MKKKANDRGARKLMHTNFYIENCKKGEREIKIDRRWSWIMIILLRVRYVMFV